MRGKEESGSGLFSYVKLEERVPLDHPLRAIRALADEALASLSDRFEGLYSRTGRPSIAATGDIVASVFLGALRADADGADRL